MSNGQMNNGQHPAAPAALEAALGSERKAELLHARKVMDAVRKMHLKQEGIELDHKSPGLAGCDVILEFDVPNNMDAADMLAACEHIANLRIAAQRFSNPPGPVPPNTRRLRFFLRTHAKSARLVYEDFKQRLWGTLGQSHGKFPFTAMDARIYGEFVT